MGSSIRTTLSFIFLATLAIQILVAGQNFEESVENESYLRGLLNALMSQWSRPPSFSSSDDNDMSEEAPDDDRYQRDMNSDENLCEMVHHIKHLPKDDMYEYRPSFYIETFCTRHSYRDTRYENRQARNSRYCHRDSSNGCKNDEKEITIFRRKKTNPACWEPLARKISVGCKYCHGHEPTRERTQERNVGFPIYN